MSEEENQSVEETQEAVALATESEEHNDVSEEVSEAEQRKRNDAEYNWAELRRQREKDRRELEDLKAELNNLRNPKQPEPEEDWGIKDDDLLEGKHLKELKKEIKQLKSELKQKEISSIDEKVQMKFPDYTEIVTQENIEYLKQTEPELAQSLYHMSDPYSQMVAAYKLIKNVKGKTSDFPEAEKKKAKENLQKPVSVNAVTKQSAIGNAHLFENGLTPDLKKQLWEEMQQIKKFG